jgi:hypothetical protein
MASPWINLFADKLNFQFHGHFDPHSNQATSEYVNTNPLPGERREYGGASTAPKFGVAYGLVARVPNLTGTGKVLLICGQKFTGLEAAGEYATDPKAAAELVRSLGVTDVGHLPDFEALVETYSIDTAPKYVKLIAFRRIGS